jgi:hypothetical protein
VAAGGWSSWVCRSVVCSKLSSRAVDLGIGALPGEPDRRGSMCRTMRTRPTEPRSRRRTCVVHRPAIPRKTGSTTRDVHAMSRRGPHRGWPSPPDGRRVLVAFFLAASLAACGDAPAGSKGPDGAASPSATATRQPSSETTRRPTQPPDSPGAPATDSRSPRSPGSQEPAAGTGTASAAPSPYVRVLGTVQDGGLPHPGCSCVRCESARHDPARRSRRPRGR